MKAEARAGRRRARTTRGGDAAEQVAGLVRRAGRVVALTGAGMSSESGVPTFRDALTGWWARYDPMALATPEAFARQPAVVFGWYVARLRRARAAVPHAGHHALARLADRAAVHVVTQNVDGLHQRAGSRDVVELHGSLEAFRCVEHGHPYDGRRLATGGDQPERTIEPPACEECGGTIRPGVVWFGEPLPAEALRRAWALVERCDLLLVIGTSSLVYPAADLPRVAQAAGAPVVEINPDATPLSPSAAVAWRAPAGVALPLLAERVGGPVAG